MATRSPANSAGIARCVAVDLGPRFVRVVEVEQAGTETRMVRRGAAALPPNCWNEVAANREGMAASIREAMSSAGIVTKSVVACLPRRLVTVRFARLPQAPPEQIRGMIEFEAQQYILFPLNEVILDYHVPTGIGTGLVSGQDDMQTVLLVAARRSLVADIVSVFDRVGAELTQLSVSALALAEHVRDSLEPTAVIALESGAMDVSVVADGQLLFTRSSALEVAGIAREVASRRFSEEVARSFTAYQNEFRQKPLAHVYLCGSETATTDGDWMDQALIEALEKPVARLHNRLLPAADADARSYAIASGMALEALGGALSDINLVPNDRAEARLQVRKNRQRQLIGLGVAAALVAGLFYVKSAIADQEKRRIETVAANKAMDEAQKEEKPVQRSHDRVTALDRVLTKSLDREHPSVDVLVALNRCLPKSTDIWLTQLNFDRGGLMTVRGDSKNSRSVTDLLINLQASGAFMDVRLCYLADAQDTATGGDVVQAAPAAPPVTPLPGLQPTVTNPIPGTGIVPGVLPSGGAASPAGGGFNPAGGNSGGFRGGFNPGGGFRGGFNPGGGANPAGGFNPGGGGANPAGGGNPGGGFGPGSGGNPGGGFRGGFNPGNPNVAGVNPGNLGPGGTAAVSEQQAAAFGQGGAQSGEPGQFTNTFQAGAAQNIQGGGNPGFAGGRVTPPAAVPPGVVTQAGGGRVVITPDMGMAGGGRGGFDPSQGGSRRQFRNGVTGGPGTSSVNMAGSPPGSQPAVGAVTALTTPPAAPTARKRVVATKTTKPTLTGFVITCRLKPGAKLIPPGALDTAQGGSSPTRTRVAAPTVVSQGATDNTDDIGDEQ